MSLFWDQLLQLMKEGHVILIVGRDLLSVRYQGRGGESVPDPCAALAEYLRVSPDSLPEGEEINAVACRYLSTMAYVDCPKFESVFNGITHANVVRDGSRWLGVQSTGSFSVMQGRSAGVLKQ